MFSCVRVCVCVLRPLTGLGSLVMKGAAANRCVSAAGALCFDWLAVVLLRQDVLFWICEWRPRGLLTGPRQPCILCYVHALPFVPRQVSLKN